MEKINTYTCLNNKLKWKGVFDYRIIVFILIYLSILYNILNFLNISILYTIYILFLSLMPIMGLYLSLNKEENVFDVIKNIFKYFLKSKNYLNYYRKTTELEVINNIRNRNESHKHMVVKKLIK